MRYIFWSLCLGCLLVLSESIPVKAAVTGSINTNFEIELKESPPVVPTPNQVIPAPNGSNRIRGDTADHTFGRLPQTSEQYLFEDLGPIGFILLLCTYSLLLVLRRRKEVHK